MSFCPRCRKEYSAARRFCPEDGERLKSSISDSSFHAKKTGRIGAIVGTRYQIKGSVGKGGTSRVYLADDLFNRRPVVIKLLSTGGTSATQERFLREAKAIARVSHPNVVKTFDAGQLGDGTPYLVLEPLAGETLGEYLRRERSMSADMALPILRQAAAGLAAAHEAGVVHRDVKPDNVFLLGEIGEPFGVKIVDFGFAKLKGRSKVSAAGTVLGTIDYMAPEQVVSEAVDERSDVYALGAVAYRALAGRLPFQVKDDMQVLAHQLFSTAPTPSSLGVQIDESVELVLMTALRKHPGNRYRTMRAMLEDLERLVGVRPGDAEGAPLSLDPDRYEFTSEMGESAGRVLVETLGKAGSRPR